MHTVVTPDAEQVTRWLEQANIQFYICDQCHGLHFSELQSREGVVDARLFVEEDGLLLSTELELRPAAIFAAQAELSRLNMDYPSLKLFLDINDDALPRMVACDLLLGRQGVTFDQFIYFVQATLDATVQLLEDCQQADWLFWPDEDETPPDPGGALH
ncbi:YbjN domain-containing protein [Alloalcanivorax gelatiniphagus]|uniref:YbjN domain-containing protein n=1 Tax=Alloalcanivorax gelatiniphagus TaxID=1194167 RepID=A0ABY2XMQ4_9GAMM|nr:YbjN domain-containing protein [Alloalcanivorax gelatiniphagus]TMW13668.1 YbjN domain-containing protein [Alloalcanivorax gelatiniphagus]|tara:strand:- start:1077 stop:1550 length:474 start_codon:yes stop_codon:yes gene_type:complete